MVNKEAKQLGTLLAMYVLTSEDDFAKAFRAEYRRLLCEMPSRVSVSQRIEPQTGVGSLPRSPS